MRPPGLESPPRPGGEGEGPMNRRTFLCQSAYALSAAAVAGAAAGVSHAAQPAAAATTRPAARPNRIAVSTYSFWRFRPDSKLSIEQCIDEAAAMGFDGVEILHRQMEGED